MMAKTMKVSCKKWNYPLTFSPILNLSFPLIEWDGREGPSIWKAHLGWVVGETKMG